MCECMSYACWVPMEARDQYQVFDCSPSQLNLELANSACMASQFALGMFCLHFPSTGIRGRPPCSPNIIMDVGDVHTGSYD